ncbi:MAG: hypothetical protein D6790_04545 [Caldilineae bacterium]|nr:MAG: hypothetical protein D6790_04545 [Caldilineae bacterium]
MPRIHLDFHGSSPTVQHALLIFVALFLGGCAAPGLEGGIFQGPATVIAPYGSSPAGEGAQRQPSPVQRSLAELSANRILVIGVDGNLFTVDPDSGERFYLTEDASRERRYLQPTWSPAGEWIAWTQANDPGPSKVVVARPNGEDVMEWAAPFPPFFFHWSPDGRRLAYLSTSLQNRRQTIALQVIDLSDDSPQPKTLLRGQPLYFDWAPDGSRILAHRGADELLLVDMDGAQTRLPVQGAAFAAPQWTETGPGLVVAVGPETDLRMVMLDESAAEQQEITNFRGMAAFSFSPDGRLFAFVDTDPDNPAGMNVLGPLTVLDLETGVFRQLSAAPTAGFFWSPDGRSLLFLTPELDDRRLWLRPQVWDGSQTVQLARFRPTNTFVEQYLRFADQYARSASYWSPDSTRIVITGWNERNQAGVWVQPADGSGPAVKVADGVYGVWSRK